MLTLGSEIDPILRNIQIYCAARNSYEFFQLIPFKAKFIDYNHVQAKFCVAPNRQVDWFTMQRPDARVVAE